MYMTKTQLRSCARGNLLGHYRSVVGGLLLTVIVWLFVNIPFTNMIMQGVYFSAIPRIVIGVIGFVIVFIIGMLLFAGVSRIHLQLARNRKPVARDILYAFLNQPGKFVGFDLLRAVIGVACLLPGLLCLLFSVSISFDTREVEVVMRTLMIIGHFVLLAGIILFVYILHAWALTVFILLDNTNLRMREAQKKSREIMHRRKWQLFLLILTFLGWIVFCILSFGLALLWVVPYIHQSIACFYLDHISATAGENEQKA
ncbi:MAG: DUF975 family protein [Lachnospiraceae bacterium]|nr:DUF975 family protein [Lachnospiraceae bacterium]